jgi:hypothetical protein
MELTVARIVQQGPPAHNGFQGENDLRRDSKMATGRLDPVDA